MGLAPWSRSASLPKGRRLLDYGVRDSFAVARTARREQPEALQGFHSTNMLFVIDEASGVDDLVFEVGQGAMSTPGAKTVMTGNPTRTSGYFYDAFHRMAPGWRTMRVGCSESSQVAPAFTSEMAQRYGVGSNVYRVRVEGEFPLADEDSVVPASLVAAAMERAVEPAPTTPVIWGLDVARRLDSSPVRAAPLLSSYTTSRDTTLSSYLLSLSGTISRPELSLSGTISATARSASR
jgi:hypothetical protein